MKAFIPCKQAQILTNDSKAAVIHTAAFFVLQTFFFVPKLPDFRDFSLFHRLNHGLDELDFLIREVVLRIEVGIRPRTGEVLEGDEAEVTLCYVN